MRESVDVDVDGVVGGLQRKTNAGSFDRAFPMSQNRDMGHPADFAQDDDFRV